MKKLTIGKAPTNDIIIENDPTVSRSHAHLTININISITDLNSTNGTYVNGVKIHGTQVLKSLDVVRVGNSLVDWASYNEGKTIMDYNEKDENQFQDIEGNILNFSTSVRSALDIMVYWGKFLAILGYIFLGLMVIGLLVMISNSSHYYRESDLAGVIVGYVIGLALYYFPTSFLYKFSDKTRNALNSDSQEDIEEGLNNLSYLFKFWGICTIVILSIYAFIFLVMIANNDF
jgi:hypothetical protein